MIGRLRTLLCRLDERERTIISLRFGLDGERPRTLSTVSEAMQRTRERVRQIQVAAIAKLRAMMDAEGIL
jgi:DNA-directed RNA polymerase sigma subunit (sigma70/sigma32)